MDPIAREVEMSRLWEAVKHEFHEVLPPMFFGSPVLRRS